jgi:hypothetical protein
LRGSFLDSFFECEHTTLYSFCISTPYHGLMKGVNVVQDSVRVSSWAGVPVPGFWRAGSEPKPLKKLLPRPPQRERAGVRAILLSKLYYQPCYSEKPILDKYDLKRENRQTATIRYWLKNSGSFTNRQTPNRPSFYALIIL